VQRNGYVVRYRQILDQVERLKHEADLLVAQPRASIVAQCAHSSPVEPVLTGSEGLQQACDTQEGRLAGAGRPGDGDEFTFADLQRKVP
jgi:hypothetical protein